MGDRHVHVPGALLGSYRREFSDLELSRCRLCSQVLIRSRPRWLTVPEHARRHPRPI